MVEVRALVTGRQNDALERFYVVADLYTAGRAHQAANDNPGAREILLEAERLAQIEIATLPNSLSLANTRFKVLTALAQVDSAKAEEWTAAAAAIWKSYPGPKNEFVDGKLAKAI